MSRKKVRIALVTGAGGAIGKAIAEWLALRSGCEVCALDVNAEAVREVVVGIVEKGGRASAYVADLAAGDSLKEVCSAVESDFGGVDILVNNAAIGGVFPTDEYPESSWHEIMAVNLTAPFLLTKQFLPSMRRKAWGRVINISSINGLRAGSGRLAYGTSKTAIIGLTRQLAVDTAQWGVTVNAIAPGAIETPMLSRMASMGNSSKESLLEFVPMNRFGLPDEVASTASFLVSNDAAYITGQTIAVDGGFSAAGILVRDLFETRGERELNRAGCRRV